MIWFLLILWSAALYAGWAVIAIACCAAGSPIASRERARAVWALIVTAFCLLLGAA